MSNDFIKAVAFAAEKHKNQLRKDADASPLEKIFDELMSKSKPLVF